jgi:hypothetical protein
MQANKNPKTQASSLAPYLTSQTDVGLYQEKVQPCNDNVHIALAVHLL